MLPLTDSLLLFTAAGFATALNAVAGGGTFFAFPILLFTGVPPIAANATCTLAVWPGSLASLFAYRRELVENTRHLPWMILIALLGGWLGALLLLRTPQTTFEYLIPWLLLIATLLFAYGKKLAAAFAQVAGEHHQRCRWGLSLILQCLIAIYGGYFGAGIGILTLAMLHVLGMQDIHRMNALKTALTSAMNASAVLTFLVSGVVYWPAAIVMLAGGVLGGYGGARFAMRIPQHYLRRFVITLGSAMTTLFFYQYYL
ncbi:MAG: sulfite exporter TauE/SafE family protein [Rickettsiales bacterium]|nr:sulfite exporter TauE/SafE family protein [Rickettsiales bacterium]